MVMMAQVKPPGAAGEAAATVTEQAPPEGGLFGGLAFFLPAMMAVMILYFLIMKPANRAQQGKVTPERLANLKKNDRVVTAGGILGTVVNIRQDAEHVTIRIDESSGAKMQILKQSIIRVVSDEENKDG